VKDRYSDRMERGRAYEEAEKLGHRYPVEYSESERRLVLKRFDYPKGWSPRFAPLRYDLPKTYPRDIPTVYISNEVSYEDGRLRHLMRNIAPSDNREDWSKWCIEEHKAGWDPETDTLMKLTTMMRASLKNPNSNNPFEEMEEAG
jgi:hypothetical protein